MKTARGLEWQPLLDSETVNDSIVARATTMNPEGALKLQERRKGSTSTPFPQQRFTVRRILPVAGVLPGPFAHRFR